MYGRDRQLTIHDRRFLKSRMEVSASNHATETIGISKAASFEINAQVRYLQQDNPEMTFTVVAGSGLDLRVRGHEATACKKPFGRRIVTRNHRTTSPVTKRI